MGSVLVATAVGVSCVVLDKPTEVVTARVKTLAAAAVGVGEGRAVVGVGAAGATVAVGSGSAAGVPPQAVPSSKTRQRVAKRINDAGNVRLGNPIACRIYMNVCFEKVLKFFSYLRNDSQGNGRPDLSFTI